jgi:hypothetical protein
MRFMPAAIAGLFFAIMIACAEDPCLPLQEQISGYCKNIPGAMVKLKSPVCEIDTLCPGHEKPAIDTCQPGPTKPKKKAA